MTTSQTISPKGELLRKAVRWLSEQHRHEPQTVEEACRRFDLSPLDEEFVMSHFVQRLMNESASHDLEGAPPRAKP